jgi:tetratricopeptide (TPR) repeat protein
VHLLESEPGSDPQAHETLSEAGQLAMARGAPQVAVTLLRRALVELPPHATEQAELLHALGTAENEADLPEAHEHHQQALELAEDPLLTARAILALGWTSGVSHPPAWFIAMVDRAAERVRERDRELALSLEAMALMILFMTGERAEMGQRVKRLRMLPGIDSPPLAICPLENS